MRQGLAILVVLGCFWMLHNIHLSIQQQLHTDISALEDRIETYYEPQTDAFETTLQNITEYITQTDMFLNVGGGGVRPEYYDSVSFDLISDHQNTDFYELLATTELFFNARAEYFDTIPNIWPLRYSRHMRVTSPFGPRFSPFTGDMQQHNGIDLVSTYRAEILATAPGVVEEHWILHPTLGKYVIINHDDRYRTHYAHLSESYVRERNPDMTPMRIERGQIIGRIGDTGRSVGSHLHYAIEVRNEETEEWEFVDPQAFLLRAIGDENAPAVARADEAEITPGVGGE